MGFNHKESSRAIALWHVLNIEFLISFMVSRLVRVYTWVYEASRFFFGGKVEVACISNYRDLVDVKKFGFRGVHELPTFLPWIMFNWCGVTGRLYMIGSITEQIAGDEATSTSISCARDQFIEAVKRAVSRGANTILFAAATKRLFKKGELEELFPEVTFTLGDNFTGLLLGEQILQAFRNSNINPRDSRVLLIAPYGLLGSVSLHYLSDSGCELVCMGNPKRRDLLMGLTDKYQFTPVFDFAEVGKVDMVVACNSSSMSKLTSDRVELIRRDNKRLIVVDPNEPQNMTPELFEASAGKILRYDAGNGYSDELTFVLGGFAAGLLRLSAHVVWGCFCEALIIAKYRDKLAFVDWYDISPKNITIISRYFGSRFGEMELPPPTNFNEPIRAFDTQL